MRAVIKAKQFCYWPGEIRKQLMALTIRDWSGMRVAIRCNKALDTWVVFEDKTPVGWCLVEFDRLDETYNIMIYVRRSHRRLGYGSRLLTKAKKFITRHNAKYSIYPDPYNYKFFKAAGEKTYGF